MEPRSSADQRKLFFMTRINTRYDTVQYELPSLQHNKNYYKFQKKFPEIPVQFDAFRVWKTAVNASRFLNVSQYFPASEF